MKIRIDLRIVFAISLILSVSAYSETPSPLESLESVADCLVNYQNSYGAWGPINEWNYTGPILAGLVQAYEITDNNDYKETAEQAADFIILWSNLNFLGDEAYALARLGQVTKNQIYTDTVKNFYDNLDTQAYIQGYDETFAEKAAFYISFHAVAAKIVGARDADIWRNAIISYLSLVDDDEYGCYYPVMTLGVATWALAQTGPMDDTMIDPSGLIGLERWQGVTLRDLPNILAAHQVISDDYKNGSFYVRFDHTVPGIGYYESGYTEDTIYALLGLISANNYREDINDINETETGEIAIYDNSTEDINDSNNAENGIRIWNFDKEIKFAREVLNFSIFYTTDDSNFAINLSGMVSEHILGNEMHYFFGGELLETFDKTYIYPEDEEIIDAAEQ